jgi:splicing factor 3B subunit 3
MYFEPDSSTGNLITVEKKVLDSDVVCLDIGPIPSGRMRCKFAIIGFSDACIRVYSLDSDTCLVKIATQSLPYMLESVALIEMKNFVNSTENTENDELFLHIGLSNGVLLRTSVDNITGNLSDTRTRYLGNKAVKLFKVKVQGNAAVLAVSSKPWLCYNYLSKYFTTTLNTEPMDFVSGFFSEEVGEGIVSIVKGSLKIHCIDRLGEFFNQSSVDLRYTPRKILLNPETRHLIILESETNTLGKREKDDLRYSIAEKTNDAEYLELEDKIIGLPYAEDGKWGSCIRMIEPFENKLLDLIELEQNEAVFSGCVMNFITQPEENFLIIGTAKDMKLFPRSYSSASIIVFAFRENGTKIEFVHRTIVEDLPLAFCEFQGRLLAGIGNLVRIYDLGKKKMLKKCENKSLTGVVNGISTTGQRIFVNTMSDSTHVLSKIKLNLIRI